MSLTDPTRTTAAAITVLGSFFMLGGVVGSGCSGPPTRSGEPDGGSGSPFDGSPPAPPFAVNVKIPGFDLGPFVLNGQDPNLGTVVPVDQLRYLIADGAQYATWIRTFGTSDTLQQAGLFIHQAGAKAMIGAYLESTHGGTSATAETANQQELDRLVAMANAGQADIVTVGNETLQDGTLTENELLAYIASVKAQVPASVQVSTVDTWNALVNAPEVVAAVDVVLPTIYPFWGGTAETDSLAALQADYATVQQAAGSKPIMIAETGWPSSGAPCLQAIPSQANQVAYFLSVEGWARENGVALIWFEAFSEPWKASDDDYPSWGIFDADYVLEAPFKSAFQ